MCVCLRARERERDPLNTHMHLPSKLLCLNEWSMLGQKQEAVGKAVTANLSGSQAYAALLAEHTIKTHAQVLCSLVHGLLAVIGQQRRGGEISPRFLDL